ncbi:MAG: alpha/beta fold hydrolase [Candidatus Sericytochromatia bacterium]|nr:alpha/beta fold hydrolase [Candidatus Sericytochromatia bacterium]
MDEAERLRQTVPPAPGPSPRLDRPRRRGEALGRLGGTADWGQLREVQAGGLSWRLRVGGDPAAPPLLLLHGFGWDARVWAPLLPALDLAWSVWAVDLPGHGGTQPPVPVAEWELGRAASALGSLLDDLGIPSPTVLGYSLGGRLALHLALQRPLAGLLLVGASPGLDEPEARATREAADARWADLLRQGASDFWQAWDAQPVFATRRGGEGGLSPGAREIRLSQAPESLAAAMEAFGLGRMAPLSGRLGQLSVPTIALAGQWDAKFQAHAETFARAIPLAEARVAPGAGHDVPNEAPEALVQALVALAARASTQPSEPRIPLPRKGVHP